MNEEGLSAQQWYAVVFGLEVFKGDKDRFIATHGRLRKPWTGRMKALNTVSVSRLSTYLYLEYEKP